MAGHISKGVDQKFLNLILLPHFCGICVENTNDLRPMNTKFVICIGKPINISLKKMICEVFQDGNVVLSQHVCKLCTDMILKLYRFIYNTKETQRILSCYINECHIKVEELHKNNIDSPDDQSPTNAIIKIVNVKNIVDCKQECKSEEITSYTSRKCELESVSVISSPVKHRQVEFEKVQVTCDPVKRRKLSTYTIPQKGATVKEKKILKYVRNNKYKTLDAIVQPKPTSKKVQKRQDFKPVPSMKCRKLDTKTVQPKPGSKKDFKCSICKISLPTYRSWQAHKKEQHKTVPKCKICLRIFPTAGRLIVHYKQHNKLKCKICKLLVTDSDLNEHLKINHENETHSCQDCGKLFYTANALKVHTSISHPSETQPSEENTSTDPLCLLCQRNFKRDEINSHKCKGRCPDCTEKICIHHKYLVSFSEQTANKNNFRVKCIDCDYVCAKKPALISHVNHAHLNYLPFICNDCGTKFTSKYTLQNHIYRCHMPECICRFCDKFFTDVTTLQTHAEVCEVNPRAYKCKSCPASFVNQAKLTIHGRLRHSLDYFACDNINCYQKFLTEEALKRHKQSSHGGIQHLKKKRPWWICGKCDKKFDRKVECDLHRETHDPNEKYKCSMCDKEFDTLKSCRRHIHNHRRSELGKKKYECGRCELRFGTIEQCTRHRATHDPKDMFKCRKCNKEFESAEKFRAHTYRHSLQSKQECQVCGKLVMNLEGHMETHVLEGRNFICDKCGKTFKSNLRLKAHQAVHNDVMVKCDICKKLVKAGRLSYHKERHTKTMRWYVHCEYCNKKVTKKNYEAHINGHHLFIRPYSCDTCNKKFHAEKNLKVHMKLHSEVKVFRCENCSKIFHSSKGLERHGLLHTGERPFTCDICGRGFITITRMKDHRRKHFEKTVACPICSSMFYALNLMRSHFKKVHWKDKDQKYDPKELVSEEFHYLFEDRRKPPVKSNDS